MEVQCLFISLYLSLFIYLSIYLSLYLSIYLSISLSLCLFPMTMCTNIYLLILAESKQSRNKALLLNTGVSHGFKYELYNSVSGVFVENYF